MEIIDVLIAVDAPYIMKTFGPNQAGKNGQYVSLGEGHKSIYMIGTWYHVQDQADSELDVFAKPGDKIRWRMTTLSMGGNYQGIITGFVINNGANNITPPAPGRQVITIPQIDTSVSTLDKVIIKSTEDVFWESTVLYSGKVTYHTKFMLYYVGGGGGGGNGSNGGGGGGGGGGCDPCGGYHWDPFIN